MIEVWENIEGFNGVYQISNLGRVKSFKKNKFINGKILKLETSNRYGYLRISLRRQGQEKKYLIHRLVAKAFIYKGNGNIVNHKDGNKQNNNVNNLEWCTRSENDLHAFKNKLRHSVKGELHYNAKLNQKQIRIIKHIFTIPNHIGISKIANIFNVSRCTIYDIIVGNTWKHITI